MDKYFLSETGKIDSLTYSDESSDQNTEKAFIVFEVAESESDVHQAGGFDKFRRMKQNLVKVEDFQNNVYNFLKNVESVLSNCPLEFKNFNMEEIEITAEVSAEGQIGFMGTHLGVTGTGGIKFVFKRK